MGSGAYMRDKGMTHAFIDALDSFVAGRPGFDSSNYSDAASYRADRRTAEQAANDYADLRRVVAHGATDERLVDVTRGGRMTFERTGDDDAVRVDYCTGQYYPTEYRQAACRALATIWWTAVARMRPDWTGDDIRKHARHTFGIGLARRWFS